MNEMLDSKAEVFLGGIRGRNTKDGNPSWTVTTDGGVYDVESDSQLSHLMANYVEGSDSLVGKTVTVYFRRGKVVRITLIEA